MNKFFFLAATAATFLVISCNKQTPAITASHTEDSATEGTGSLVIKLANPGTKGTAPERSESAINKYIICIYSNDTGQLELEPYEVTSVQGATVSDISLDKIPFGEKTVAMAVNYANRPETETFEKFSKSVTDLKDNTSSNLVMMSFNDRVKIASGDNQLTLTLNRIAAKFHIGKIKASFDSDSRLHNPSVLINGVYICNAAGTASLSGKYAGNIYNAYTPSSTFSVDQAVQGITASTGFEIKLSDTFQSIDKYLYSYPYSNPDAPTYLVIGASFNSTQRYYRYALPEIKSNTLYNIEEITVTGAPDASSLKLSILLGEWDDDNSLKQISL